MRECARLPYWPGSSSSRSHSGRRSSVSAHSCRPFRTACRRHTRSWGCSATIPVLCMGLFAPPAAFLSARVGTRAAVTWAVLLIGVFGLARAGAPSAALVVLFTWPIGVGMGLAGALVPVAVKQRFAVRPAGPTGVYTTGIQVGAALSDGRRGTARRVVRRVAGIARRLFLHDDRAGRRLARAHTTRAGP